jgi:amino acid adenylation domain-containing protein
MRQRHDISHPAGVSGGNRLGGRVAARQRQLRHGEVRRRVYEGEACLHELVAAQAARTPGRVAVSCAGRELTYAELIERARGLAGHLRALGVGPETRVGVCAERSLELMVGLLGTLTAGAAYVPLDPSYPAGRLALMLEDSGVPVLLVQGKLTAALPPHRTRAVLLDGSAEPGAFSAPPAGPLAPSLPDSLAYVIYTSGSTGRPKGVMNAHRGVRNRLLWQREDFGLRADDRVLQKTPFSFDISVWELFAPLIAGARLVMARPGGQGDPAYLAEVMEREGITVVHFVASMLRAFLEAPGLQRLTSLRCVVNGGEALPPAVARRFYERFGKAGPRLYNLYGPTEAAVEATWWACKPAARKATVPIGRPIANVSVRILGAGGEPAAAGEPGELHIGGVAPARGYLGRPDLTAAAFLPDPFATTPGARLYKTGDVARFRRDGVIEYLGRADHQVKVRGFRIELGEIEAALAAHPSVRAAVVTARERNGEPRLAAYVLFKTATGNGDAAGLRAHLAARLPDYMVPPDFVFLAELPLTPSGKVDRKALPEPRRPVLATAAPATPLERFLAGLWRQALGVEQAGRDDSFFELGGTSISAAVVTNRLQRELGEIVHAVVLFDAPTVAGLAAYLSREHRDAVARLWGAESVADAPADLPRAGRRMGEAEIAELGRLIPLLPAAEPAAKNPPAVFILAPPRSGTTLLRVMLGGHPALFAPPELELLSFATLAERRAAFPGRDAFWLQGLLRAVMELRGGGLAAAEAIVAGWERDGWTAQRAYRQLQEWLGDRILVDKTTSYALAPAVLARAEEAFDSPFYIHLVRHPYGMIHSFAEARLEQVFFRRPHSFSRRELAELLWVASQRNIAAHLAGIPAGRRHRLRFEDLVRDPEGELRKLCAALGLDYHPDMAEPYRETGARMTDGIHAEGGMLGDMKFHQHRGVDAAVAERWRQEHTEDFLGEPAWETAAAFGYERPARVPPAQLILLAPAPRRPGEPLPLSPAQERLWFLDRLSPGSAAYNIAREIRLSGRLDVPALAAALGEIVRRHEVLRTVFRDSGGAPMQVAQPFAGAPPPLVDLAALPEPARQAEARRLAAAAARRPFDLERDAMLRCLLLRLTAGEHALLAVLHHIAADGWSMKVLARELAALYRGFAAGDPALPPLPLQYADYAVWQRRWLASAEPAARLAAWRRKLADLPAGLELPADRPRPAVQSFRGALERLALAPEADAALEGLARRGGATVFMALLAVFQTLLHRLTGQEDVAVGVPAANRNQPGLEGLIGFFVNSLVMRADFAGDPTFAAALGRVRESALFAYAHQDQPFERLVAELAPERSLDHAPLYQVMLSLRETPAPALDLGADLAGEVREIHTGTSKFDLWLQVTGDTGGLTAKAEYATDLFAAATAARLLRCFRALLTGAAAAPETRVSELPLLDDAERAQVLVEWNRTAAEIPAAPVHAQVARWAREAPQASAVAWEGGCLSYGELNRRANCLAHRLLRLGIGSGDTVALRLERSPELVVAALAALKTGGAYLPIDPAYPAERLDYMLRDSGAAVLLTVERLASPGGGDGGHVGPPLRDVAVLRLDLENLGAGESEEDPEPANLGLEGLAYVIYTSGSTGAPKGTELTHRGLANLVAWDRRYFGRGPADRCSLVAGPGFDGSVWEMWSALIAGASLHVPPAELVLSPPALLAWLAERRITVAFLPTPLAEAVLAEPLPPALALRTLVSGGDRLHRRPGADLPCDLANVYGPTECTVIATAGWVSPRGERAPAIGSPVANTRVYLLDRALHAVPTGVPGELCLAGAGLARGYRGRPGMTAERFVPDPFGGAGERLYRTGDLARWLPGGELEFLGRLDHQVKVRGFRIELGEIQAALGRHPAVREAVVLVRAGGGGLCAYVVPRRPSAAPEDGSVGRDALRGFLAASLPEYMVPAAWVFLEALPLTANGKVDRAALARIEPAAEPAAGAAPRTPFEELLAGLFAQVLELDRAVGAHEDFFHLGGHSLLATRLASRVREACGVDPGVRGVFEAPTVARLAARLAAGSQLPAAPPLVPVPRDGALPLSFAQQRLWFLETLRPGTAVYNLAQSWELRGELSVPALGAALAGVVRRHEALRTTFAADAAGVAPRQVIAPPVQEPPPAVIDLAALADPAAEADRLTDAEARRPYDLARGPLLRAALLSLGGNEYRLLLGLHHIVSDGWSMEVLAQEVSALYRAFAAGRPSPLPALAVQYPDYAVWQRRWLAGDALEEQLAWWRERLAGAPAALELPADRPRPAVPSFAGAVVRLPLGAGLTAGLAGLSRRSGATPFMTLLAAFQALLHRYTGQQDLVVGSPVAGRGRLELERLIGFFVNMLALRADLGGDPAFQGLLAALRDTALGAYAHQDLPFDRLVEELSPDRDLSRAPLFQIALAVQDAPARLDLGPGTATAAAAVHPGTAKFDLALFLERGPDGLEAIAEHATDLFDRATVRRLLGHFRVLLAGIAADPALRLSELPLLDEEEREQVVAGWNRTAAAIPDAPVHARFAERARQAPDAIAVAAGDRALTYGELDRRAARLAEALRRRGVGPEEVAALLLERSPELVTAALAVLAAGGAYLPIDPAYPDERILHMLRDSGARVLVTAGGRAAELDAGPGCGVIRLDEDPGPDGARLEFPSVAEPEGLAYVIYTSGSTGVPKGTELRHRGLSNLCAWYLRTYGLGPADRTTLVAGPGFDASVWEIWPPLVAGASLHVPAAELLRDPPALLPWMAEHGITVAFLPTPLAEAVLAEPVPAGLAVRALQTGGDRLRRRPHAGAPYALINLYGPTESTVVVAAGSVAPEGERLPGIGEAIANVRLYVLGGALQPLPLGVPGELCIAGEGLARGYRGRPEATAERFLPDPYGPPGSRLYRTGDLVRRPAAGGLDFLGRIDHQVKIRGFRIELGEVEAALQDLPAVESAAVLAREDRPGERRLAAYVVAPGGRPEELRDALLRRLPEAMVPAAWVFLAALPLTANGKIDRRALAEVAPPEAEAESAKAAPRTPAEEIVGDLFAELLGLDRTPGIHEDFFRLGGHSLLVFHLASRLRAAFGVELDLTAIFERPTVAGVAERLAAAAREHRPAAPPLVPAARGVESPLSFAQQRLWFLDRFEAGTALYNITVAFHIRGAGLCLGALAGALGEVERRHETLRSVFRQAANGEPVQAVLPFAPRGLPVVDLAGLGDAAAEAARLEKQAAAQPFDLARGPLLRTLLLRLGAAGAAEHRLVVAMHHIASDGWSVGLLVREVSALYRAFAAGLPSPLPPLPVQYADFAIWQRRWLAGGTLAAETAWWRERLAGIPDGLDLPADRPRPAAQSFRGGVRRAGIEPAVAAGLAALSRRRGVTSFMTVTAVFYALLHRWGAGEDLVVGTPVAGRSRAEIEGLIGFFVNTLVLRASLAGDPQLGELLARVRAAALAAYAHQDLPFEQLVAELAPQRDLSRAPLFQVLVSLQEAPPSELALGSGLAAPVSEVWTDTAKFDLSLHFSRAGERLTASAEYAVDLFDAATVDRLLGHLRVLLAGIVAAPESRISDLPLLTGEERRQLAAWQEAVRREHPAGEVLHGFFEAQAARTPTAVALVCGGAALTYAELERRSARLARRLRGLGVGPEVAVGVCLERRADLVVALLAVLRAGGFYVPLDPAYPSERLAYLLADSGCALVLTHAASEAALPPTSARLLRMEEAGKDEEDTGAPVSRRVLPGNLAYLIYTSGSTGRPKAVAIEHRSAVLLTYWAREVFSREEFAGVLASTSITFDMSVFEIFVTLAWGGTLILVENALALPALKMSGALPPGVEVRLLDTVPSAAAELLAMDGLPASVRTINLGGEAVPRALADRAYRRPQTERLYNLYGPSEDTTFTSIALIERRSARAPSIGVPLHDKRAWVLDRNLRPVPVGVPGELYMAGGGLARGYLGRPELTAERFVPDPHGEPGARMYRVGDLVRWRSDGELEYLGRLDHQVKIRGFRVELGEIEAALAACPGVRDAAVVAREDEPGDKRLVAYVAGEVTAAALWEALQRRLPAYMTPAAFMILEDLPRTPNGKIDRRSLPEPTWGRAGEEDAAPRTAIEQGLAEIWSQLLGVETVGIHDSFFELGGHSLLATRVASRVRELFGVELPLRAFFEQQTVARLAAVLEGLVRERSGAPAPETLAPHGLVAAPLSYPQQRLWFLDRLQPATAVYNLPVLLRLEGNLAPGVVAAALSEIVRRHAALRTTFALDPESGEPVQVVADAVPQRLAQVDLAALPEPAGRRETERLLAGGQRRPFDLDRGPLLRTLLLRLGSTRHWLTMTMHHIVSDGWSVGVLLRELETLCRALGAGRPSPLPELPMQYADFAVWQRRWLAGGELASQLAWWRQRLTGSPPALALPADRPRPAVPSLRGNYETLALDADLAAAAERLGHRQGATPFMTYLAAFEALLHRYTGERDLRVGTPVAGRTRAEIEDLIGCFVNMLVLRTDVADEIGFTALLDRVRETALAAFSHPDVPFERLVEELAPARDLSRSPLFDVSFSIQEGWSATAELAPGLAVVRRPAETATAKFDLSLGLWDGADGGLDLGAEYSLDLFEPATIRRMLGHFTVLLAAAVAEPGIPIAELPLLAAEERAQIRAAWSGGDAMAVSAPTLHGLFARRARLAPDALAIEGGAERLTYAELDVRARRLAGRLRAAGVAPEARIALCTGRTPELVVGFLGILQAGGACVPLDAAYPPERLAFILADAGAAALVTTPDLSPLLPAADLPRVLLASGMDSPAAVAGEPAPPEQLAYVIYTSGSTGWPKGVAVAHRAAAEHCETAARAYGLEADDRVLSLASPAFDAMIEEIFATLAAGAALVMDGAESWVPGDLTRKVEAFRSTVINPTTAVWQQWVRELESGGGRPRALRLVVVGGEELAAAPARRWLDTPCAAVRLLNSYGPTEAVVTATVHAVGPAGLGSGASVPIGRPLPGRAARVLDRRLQPVPLGVAGELCLGGCLARGYLGQPATTAGRFVPDPFGAPGARLYRSGDLVRLRPDGALEFLGRTDRQVKVRGFRIEPGEIEAILAAHPAVAAAVVLARETDGERRLVAYLEPRGEAPPAAELRALLEQRLPAYMVPAAFVVLERLPLTPNGKIDRRALPAPEAARDLAAELVPPRNPVEAQLARLWRTVLGVERVGIHDSFWQLGGHSLLATRIASRVREIFGVELPLRAFFEEPTIASLAERIQEAVRKRGGGMELGRIAAARRSTAPLSFAQQRLWFLDRLQPGLAVYNLPLVLRAAGPLSAALLEAALAEIVRRHAVLRTTFAVDAEGEPVQVVAAPGPLRLGRVDLSGLAEPARETEGARLLAAELRRPFDLERGPLLRSLLVRLQPGEHLLALTMHHIVSDGWSLGVLLRELRALYGAGGAGAPSPLPEPAIQYADFAVWQRRWLSGGELEAQLGWWRRHLAGGPPALELPADHPRPAVQSSRGGIATMTLAPELAAEVERLGLQRGATLFMTLLAAFAALLHRYAGQDDLWIGTPVAHRTRTETEELIGFFVNTLVLRTDLQGQPGFTELLGRVRETALAAVAHQDAPFEKLVEDLAPQRDMSRNPLLAVLFSVESERAAQMELAPGLTLATLPNDNGTAKLDLSLGFWKTADGALVADAEYALDLFEPATARRLLGHLNVLLAGAVAQPETAVADLPLLTAIEQRQVLVDWNETASAYPRQATLHELFEKQTAQAPDAVALTAGDEVLTYAELDRRAGRLAVRLRALGVGPDACVGICARRSADLIAGFLGILQAGGAYVPLDPQYPRERLQGMLADVGARVLVVEDGLAAALPAIGVRLSLTEALGGAEAAGPAVVPTAPENLAYVLFTSGSTGRPKGVAVTHRNVVRLVREIDYARFGPAEVFLQLSPVTFDASTLEIWGPLLNGGRLVVFPPGPPSLEELGTCVARHAVSTLFLTTGLFNQMVEGPLERLRAVGQLMTGGDVGSPVHLHQAVRALPQTKLIHCYGPTEGTTYTTCHPLTAQTGTPVPIGRPIANTRVYVLDAGLRPVPPGVPGKLYVAGDGLARGYVNRPRRTAERFVPDPVSGEPGARLYDSGDLVRWRAGELEFLGRADSQVKLRGFRIEPGEIEAALESHPGVRTAVVIAREDRPGDKRLVAYVVPGGEGLEPAELRRMLQAKLPQFMVPSAIVLLEALPLTAHGKIDRGALPAPDAARDRAELVPPRTPLEEQVADLWRTVLGVERIGVHDSFWELGGHSLLATKILSRVRQEFGVELPLSTLFTGPSLAELAEAVGRSVLAAEGDEAESLLAELDGLSDDEIRALLATEEPALEERT